MKERLSQIIEYYKLSVREFERIIGVSEGVINKTLQRNTGLKAETIQKIVEKFPQISLNWIVLGQGEMFNNSANNNIPIAKQTNNPNEGIPLIPVEAIAGIPSIDEIGVTFADCKKYVVPEFESKGADYMIRVSGSSMYPKYSNGDILACKYIRDVLFLQWGKIYVIDSSQGALVKRVFQDENNPDNLILVSDNKENYPPFAFPKSDIRSISIVVGVIRLE